MEQLSFSEKNSESAYCDLSQFTNRLLQEAMVEAENILRKEVHLHGFPKNNGDLKEFCRGERLLANVYVDPTACSGIDIQPPSIHDFLLMDKLEREATRYKEIISSLICGDPQRDDKGNIVFPSFIDSLTLPQKLRDDIVNSRVRAWILDGKLLLSSVYSSNPESQKVSLENLISAVNIAKKFGLDEVGFDGSPENLHNLRQIGLFDRAPCFYTGRSEKTLKQMRKSVKKDYMHTDAGNLVFYVPATHERLVTVSTVEALGKIINNRSLFLERLNELVTGRKLNSLGTSNFDFLTVGEKQLNDSVSYYRKKEKKELEMIHNELSVLNDFCQGISNETWHTSIKLIRKNLNKFLDFYKNRTAKIFYKDEMFNPQWLRVQYGINRGIDEETNLANLPDEFSGMFRVEKCGYIGWIDQDNKVHLGSRPLKSSPEGLDKAESVSYKDKKYYIVRSDNSEEASKIYFKDENQQWFERTYVFQDGMSQTIKEFQNWSLEYRPDLKWSCVASIPEIVSLWDNDPEMIKNLWYPDRSVFFVQMETESGEKENFWISEFPWSKNLFEDKKNTASRTAMLQEAMLKRFIKMQHRIMNEFGANCPEFIYANFLLPLNGNKDNLADKKIKLSQMPFVIRKYLAGNAMGHIRILSNNKITPEWCLSYGSVLGKLAAINLASRKKVFESVDEVIDKYDIDGNPVGASYVSSYTTFRYERVTKPLIDDAPLYGFHLALLKRKIRLAHDEKVSENMEKLFFSNFETSWRTLQNKLYQQDISLMKFIDSYYSLSVPVDEIWDFRKTFRMANDAIKSSKVEELIEQIYFESQKAQTFFKNIITNVDDTASINEIFQEAIYLLNSVWLSPKGVDHVYDIVNRDQEFSHLKVKERIHRLNVLHTNLTCQMLNLPIEYVIQLVSDFSKKGKPYLAMRNTFITNFNSIFQKQFQSKIGLNPGLAQRFFDALHYGGNLQERVNDLAQRGYLY